jgi:importin subunit alpha-6/7
MSLLRMGSWAISCFCEARPRPTPEAIQFLPTIAKLILSVDAEVLSYACWALSQLCDVPPSNPNSTSNMKQVMEADVCWRLVQLLMHRNWRVTKPALRALGNIVCAEDEADYTQHIIEAGCVSCLKSLVSHTVSDIQKEACWTLSNIAAGTVTQIQSVIDSGVIPILINMINQKQEDHHHRGHHHTDEGKEDGTVVVVASATAKDVIQEEVKNEACWVILNAASCGSDRQIDYLVETNCVSVLSDLLAEPSMVMMALEGLERILQVKEKEKRKHEYASFFFFFFLSHHDRDEEKCTCICLFWESKCVCLIKVNYIIIDNYHEKN